MVEGEISAEDLMNLVKKKKREEQMKNFRAKSGPFRERPHYELREIERICEEALSQVELLP